MTPRPVKLPKYVRRQLEQLPASRLVIAAVLAVTNDQVDGFRHIGLSLSGGKIVTGDPAPPPPSNGRFARRNLDGWREKRKDLPKECREVTSTVPSWNSGSYHSVIALRKRSASRSQLLSLSGIVQPMLQGWHVQPSLAMRDWLAVASKCSACTPMAANCLLICPCRCGLRRAIRCSVHFCVTLRTGRLRSAGLGCHEAQGYRYGKPAPEDAIVEQFFDGQSATPPLAMRRKSI